MMPIEIHRHSLHQDMLVSIGYYPVDLMLIQKEHSARELFDTKVSFDDFHSI